MGYNTPTLTIIDPNSSTQGSVEKLETSPEKPFPHTENPVEEALQHVGKGNQVERGIEGLDERLDERAQQENDLELKADFEEQQKREGERSDPQALTTELSKGSYERIKEKAQELAEKVKQLDKFDYASAAILSVGALGTLALARTLWHHFTKETPLANGQAPQEKGSLFTFTNAALLLAGAFLGREVVGTLLGEATLLGSATETASKAYEDLKNKGSRFMLDSLLAGHDPEIEALSQQYGISQFVLSRVKETPVHKFLEYKNKEKKSPYLFRFLNNVLPKDKEEILASTLEEEAKLYEILSEKSENLPADTPILAILNGEAFQEKPGETGKTVEVEIMTPEELAEQKPHLKSWLMDMKDGSYDGEGESAAIALAEAIHEDHLKPTVKDGVLGIFSLGKEFIFSPITVSWDFIQTFWIAGKALYNWNEDDSLSTAFYEYFEAVGDGGILENHFGEYGAVAMGAATTAIPAALGGAGALALGKADEAANWAWKGATLHWRIGAKAAYFDAKSTIWLKDKFDGLWEGSELSVKSYSDLLTKGNASLSARRDLATYHAEKYKKYYDLKHRPLGFKSKAVARINQTFQKLTGFDFSDVLLKQHAKRYIAHRDELMGALTQQSIGSYKPGITAETFDGPDRKIETDLLDEIETTFESVKKDSAQFERGRLVTDINAPKFKTHAEYDAKGYKTLSSETNRRLTDLNMGDDISLKLRELIHEADLSETEIIDLLEKAKADPAFKKDLVEVLFEKKWTYKTPMGDLPILKAFKTAGKVMSAYELVSTIQGYSAAPDKASFLMGKGIETSAFFAGRTVGKATLGRLTGNRLAQEVVGVGTGLAATMLGADRFADWTRYYGKAPLLKHFPNHEAYLGGKVATGVIDTISTVTGVPYLLNALDLADSKVGFGIGDGVDENTDPLEYFGKTVRVFNPLSVFDSNGWHLMNDYRDHSLDDFQKYAKESLGSKRAELEAEELKDFSDMQKIEALKTAIARLEDFVDGSWIRTERIRMQTMQGVLQEARDGFGNMIEIGAKTNKEEARKIFGALIDRIWQKGTVDIQTPTEQAMWDMLSGQKVTVRDMMGNAQDMEFFDFILALTKFKQDLRVYKTMESEMKIESPEASRELLAA